MCKVISVANIKGGVAKTTTAANLGVLGILRFCKKISYICEKPRICRGV